MEKNVTALESRIKLLDNEDSKIMKKIDLTRKMADKIAAAQERQEQKLEFM